MSVSRFISSEKKTAPSHTLLMESTLRVVTGASHYRQELSVSSKNSSASFLEALGADAKEWEDELIEWINTKLGMMCRVLLRDTGAFATPWRLADRYKNRFRISTFVNMYRMRDPEAFQKLGYAPNESPLGRVCRLFAQQDITITDVTDTNRGLTLWLRISFRAPTATEQSTACSQSASRECTTPPRGSESST
jgi:hypothetical protein